MNKQQNICTVYGYGVIAEIAICEWFTGFRSGNANLKDQKHILLPFSR